MAARKRRGEAPTEKRAPLPVATCERCRGLVMDDGRTVGGNRLVCFSCGGPVVRLNGCDGGLCEDCGAVWVRGRSDPERRSGGRVMAHEIDVEAAE